MADQRYLRTSELAHAGGVSTQQIRNYEAAGLLPPTERSASGYRRYTPQHLAAVQTTRCLVRGYGWPRTSAMMQALHRGQLASAVALIDACHAELASKRRQIEQTLGALHALVTSPASLPSAQQHPPLWVGEAAKQVGVRVSAVHFWERQGLLQPQREQSNGYRSYDAHQMERLRIVALLRHGGYDFEAIQRTLDELAAGRVEQAILALEKQQAHLTHTSWLCIEAGVCFQRYVSDFCPHLLT